MDLNLNCANIFDNGKGIEIPPKDKHANKYPVPIGVRALREYIARGGEVLVIPVEDGSKNKQTEQAEQEI